MSGSCGTTTGGWSPRTGAGRPSSSTPSSSPRAVTRSSPCPEQAPQGGGHMAKHGLPLGIDVGGSGIKGAPVALESGTFAAKRKRMDTPVPATPEAIADVINQIVDQFDDVRADPPLGITTPPAATHALVGSAP